MNQENLFKEIPPQDKNITYIGNRLYFKFADGNKSIVTLFHNDVLVKSIDLSDQVAKRIFIIEAVELGAKKSHLAEALNISRQSIDNYLNTKKYFGLEGLLNNYSPSRSKNIRKHRIENTDNRRTGNKIDNIKEIRQKEQEKLLKQSELLFGGYTKTINPEDQPFTEEHGWQSTRYAGVFTYLITLVHLNDWLGIIMTYFGDKYKIFLAFLLMFAKGMRSIEQLKHVARREAGLVLGLMRMPIRQQVHAWLHSACKMQVAGQLIAGFFRSQVSAGIVGTWVWFTDGHLLPYTGKEKTHHGFNTQRQLMVPGRTNQVTCDISGRVVDFEIQEGKGDMRSYLVTLGQKWKYMIDDGPVMVFDREGYGSEFFFNMNQAGVAFVTWEKHIDKKKLDEVQPNQFKEEFEVNEKIYRVFEDEKVITHTLENKETISFVLRRIYIWNVTSNRKTCALSNTGVEKMDNRQCATAILSRWGASENTFKHMADKHPLNYQPGYEFVESEKQLIVNPDFKEIKRDVKLKMKNLGKLCKKLSKSSEVFNKDGSIRENSKHQLLKVQIQNEEAQIEKLNQKAKQLPVKIDISSLEDYRCFQRISDESKYLFDFVTSSAWNARKQMVEWLSQFYGNKNEYVDLFYAITNCHGWIKSEKDKVVVRLEPLQQHSRRSAQIQFCRKLTQLAVITPGGKALQIEVGNSPID